MFQNYTFINENFKVYESIKERALSIYLLAFEKTLIILHESLLMKKK